MDIRHLQYVHEIVRLNSFTKAAQALHITQPTISKAIKNLEAELNVELFTRDGKQVKLTDAGQAISHYAVPILHLFDQLQGELKDLTYLNKGSIRIGLPPMAGANFFPSVIKKFQKQYEGIAIKMIEDGANKIQGFVEDGSIDVGVVLSPIQEELFESFLLVKDELKVIVPLTHKLASQQQIELIELKNEKFILFNSDFTLHDRIITACRLVGFEAQIVYESSQWDFIGEMVGAELGIAMLPDTICQLLNPEKVKAIPLLNPSIPWQLMMVWRKEGYLSLAAREWIRFTKDIFVE
ncbi:LysR family transcriptional regulator [Paenibacillus sp. HWE-109]|uniref:LysR family transcriptional regulator n=1 Tax=Paenibacillus sp. HWE-109 TaxID=1306526 RepID=UPI001EDEF4F9|nr:LysR family transcriptional regulator [Paenibacillus sp. HWE-109]UKS31071.1 LysR family transcriptional regulator [Paenibacillus sp. HWE-109]